MSLSYVDALAFAIMWMTAANFIAQKEFSDGGTLGDMVDEVAIFDLMKVHSERYLF
jgi:hypothetical protein